MDTTDDIVAVEAEYGLLLCDPRRPLSRFVAVSLTYGRMLADPDPQQALDVLAHALETLHDPPAPAEARIALELLRTLRPVASRLGLRDTELDAIGRERRLFDARLAEPAPGERESLRRRAAAVRFSAGDVREGFGELMDGLRSCGAVGLDELSTDLILAIRRHHVPDDFRAEVEAMWVELRRQRFDGNWPLWCLTALGALRLDAGDVVTALMYVRRSESILGHLRRPVACALVGGWAALADDDFPRALDRFTFASGAPLADDRIRLLAVAGLGEALVCLGRPDEARAPLAEAISYDLGDPKSIARCHELLSEIASSEGRHSDAYGHLQATRRLEQLARGDEPMVERVAAGDGLSMVGAPAEYVDLRDKPARVHLPVPSVDLSPAGLAASMIADGMDSGQLRLHYQVVHDNTANRAGAVEGLLRFDHPQTGVLRAAEFLSDLEDRDVAEKLCAWTIDRACETLMRWSSAGHPLAVLVNVNALQMTPALPLIVRTALARSGARSDLLTLELDGRAAASIEAAGLAILDEVRAIGASIGVDRFGGEFRSVDTLLRLPVDVVKLDQSVFGGNGLGAAERRMVESVVALASAFGFEVIATGIETEEQFHLQRGSGCHGAQGLWLGAPAPEADLRERLARVA